MAQPLPVMAGFDPAEPSEETPRQAGAPWRLREIALVTAGDIQKLGDCHRYHRYMLEALRRRGLPAAEIAVPPRPYPLAVLALRSDLRRHQPSVVVVDSTAAAVASPLVSWMRMGLQARVVALMQLLPSELFPLWQRPARRYLETRLLRTVDRAVAVSANLRGQLIAAGTEAERVSLISPGKDGVPIPHTLPEMPPTRCFRFLCVADWSPTRGIHDAVEAMAALDSHVQLDLVGERGEGSYARRIHDLIRRRGLVERVHIHGPLEGERLAERYAMADAFVLPSRYEGFGTSCAEAMSFGLPVVACRVGPLPWLVEGRCGMLVPPGDVVSLVEAMAAMADYPVLHRSMREAALQRALRLPTWEESTERFCALVGGLLES